MSRLWWEVFWLCMVLRESAKSWMLCERFLAMSLQKMVVMACLHQRAQWYGAPHLSGWESAEVQLCLHQAELPCRHIFMALGAWWGTLFREKMATGSPSPASKFGICQAGSSDEMDQTDTRTHPWEAKYTELLCNLKGLADLCCNMGEEQYRGCFRLLQILEFWSAGRSVVLVVSIS